MSTGKRFKEERLRLNLSQADIADMFGASSQAVSKWEQGSSIPFDKMAVLIGRGFDIQYIVTGVRSTNLNQVQSTAAIPQDDSLESRLKRLTDTQRDVVKMMVEELERAAGRERIAKEFADKVRANGKNGKNGG